MITKETATRIAYAYREIETAEKLLGDVKKSIDVFEQKDLRDVFGRRANCLQLGILSGDTGHRLFDVPYTLAVPVIETHIAHHKAQLSALTALALAEANGGEAA